MFVTEDSMGSSPDVVSPGLPHQVQLVLLGQRRVCEHLVRPATQLLQQSQQRISSGLSASRTQLLYGLGLLSGCMSISGHAVLDCHNHDPLAKTQSSVTSTKPCLQP